jgi:hypothetical protein
MVIVAWHAHAMYESVSPDKIDFEGPRTEGSKSMNSIADVQASLQRSVLSYITFSLSGQEVQTKIPADTHVQVWQIYCLRSVSTRTFGQQVTQTFLSIASTPVRDSNPKLECGLTRLFRRHRWCSFISRFSCTTANYQVHKFLNYSVCGHTTGRWCADKPPTGHTS